MSQILHFGGLLLTNDIKFQLRKYRRVISHETEEWWKVYRKNNFWFQIWHEELDEFLPNQSKVWKFYFEELFFQIM